MLDKHKEDQEYMQKLYESFRTHLQNGTQAYYETDELLNIYDYAQDEGDDMTQFEVFQIAARLYPDNDFLDERKAFFLAAINSDAALDYKALKPRPDTVLWHMLDFTIQADATSAEHLLKKLLAKKLSWDSESVIRLFDTLQDLGRVDLVYASVEPLLSRTEFPNHMLLEAAEILFDHSETVAEARDIAEELTKREPFACANWQMLAKAEFKLERFAEALAAIDYALAIEPDDNYSLLLKAALLVLDKKTVTEALEIFERLYKQYPDDMQVVTGLLTAYHKAKRKKDALALCNAIFDRSPMTALVVVPQMFAFKLNKKEVAQALKRFEDAAGDHEKIWFDAARRLEAEGCNSAALFFSMGYETQFGVKQEYAYFIHQLYAAKLYEEVLEYSVKITERLEDEPGYHGMPPQTALCIIASLLMTGHYTDAASMADTMMGLPFVGDVDDDDAYLRYKGTKLTLMFLGQLARNPKIIPDSPDFDPLMVDNFTAGSLRHKK